MVLLILAVSTLIICWLFHLNKHYHVLALFAKRIKTVDGTPLEYTAPVPPGRTIFANTFDIIGLKPSELFAYERNLAQTLKRSFVQYGLGATFYNVITAEDAELVFNDQSLITKGLVYNFLHPFLRTGLLTATDKKWHSRRKMLTPAFHFNILEQFEEIFKEESHKFVQLLHKQQSDILVLTEHIPRFTLNSVCETALGVQLDEQLDGDAYRASFTKIEESFVKRVSNPFYMNDTLYNLFLASKYEHHLNVVHNFSSSIIEKRRKLFALQVNNTPTHTEADDIHLGHKNKRYAMLDTLLHAERDELIDHIGICEEVDTFMFEGFDTTSMGLIFGLMNLSLYPDMQERCYQEILDNIDDDLSKLDISQLSRMKYLECFIKESMRLYPSVPAIMRKAVQETKLANNLILPKGANISMRIFDIHRSEKYFPNPEVFDPERFTPENSAGRHFFAYVPFSAGQRNCIGQKFAMLEMKTLLVYILKQFKLLPLVDPKEFIFETGLILRVKNAVKVQLVKRT